MTTMRRRARAVTAAALVLVAAVGAGPALAADAATVEFPDPVKVVFSVATVDGAVSMAEQQNATVTTLSGDVNFEVDSDQLTARAKEVLDSLASEWSKAKPSTVTVTGHTDSVADDAHNLDLSKRRAKAVGDYLAGKVPGLSLTTDGKGEAEPIGDNETEEGRAQNRRVEIRAER
ncbi:OmpA family protein [Pauljensenia hongkongensis]|uniref:Cell envelope biogenesis protein OmpA n=1 Tax=Pauljensenia hongkongensis TaxID=178339 RepID=A0A1D8B3F5_9ACTO|nr:OmpA family protein [Pauljensenia hongkongensis]AOS47662.1 cell envelope biogenesis protein OmpA [Pauljensenia hongkongensis]EFW09470.1 outer membrane protein OprF [Actinomyces sp. oral taxon 178 str. F0338]